VLGAGFDPLDRVADAAAVTEVHAILLLRGNVRRFSENACGSGSTAPEDRRGHLRQAA